MLSAGSTHGPTRASSVSWRIAVVPLDNGISRRGVDHLSVTEGEHSSGRKPQSGRTVVTSRKNCGSFGLIGCPRIVARMPSRAHAYAPTISSRTSTGALKYAASSASDRTPSLRRPPGNSEILAGILSANIRTIKTVISDGSARCFHAGRHSCDDYANILLSAGLGNVLERFSGVPACWRRQVREHRNCFAAYFRQTGTLPSAISCRKLGQCGLRLRPVS
jgi:hypothetical protein